MDYVKSGDQELGTVIKHHEWVEGMEIGYWISELGQDLILSYFDIISTHLNPNPLTHILSNLTFPTLKPLLGGNQSSLLLVRTCSALIYANKLHTWSHCNHADIRRQPSLLPLILSISPELWTLTWGGLCNSNPNICQLQHLEPWTSEKT